MWHKMLPVLNFEAVWHALCLLATFAMLIFVSIRLYNDESTSVIEFQAYHGREDDIYPTISFCLTMENPNRRLWMDTDINLYYPSAFKDDITKQNYVNFLLGDSSGYKTADGYTTADEYDDISLDIGNIVMLSCEYAKKQYDHSK